MGARQRRGEGGTAVSLATSFLSAGWYVILPRAFRRFGSVRGFGYAGPMMELKDGCDENAWRLFGDGCSFVPFPPYPPLGQARRTHYVFNSPNDL